MTQKFLQAGFWWETLLKDAKIYARSCDFFQQMGKLSCRDELPLQPVRALQAFEKWAIDFIGPINPIAKHSKDRYIITMTNYLTCWVEAAAVQDCSKDIAAKFIFENIITQFGCPKSLTNDQGAHFISNTYRRISNQASQEQSLPPTGQWNSRSLQQDSRKRIEKGLFHKPGGLG